MTKFGMPRWLSPAQDAPGEGTGSPLRRRVGQGALLTGALLGGIVLGAGGLSLAAGVPSMGMMGPGLWHRHGHGLEHVQRAVAGALDSVGATSAQEAKIHDVIAATAAEVEPDAAAHDALRDQVLGLLKAPTVDRAAMETLRAAQVAKFDATSKAIVGAVLDAAEQLTPEQRVKLADRAQEMMQRHAMGEHGPRGGWRGGPPPMDGHGPGLDDGPDHGPDGGPDKG